MVIRKKPVSAEQEAKINAVIQKGGSPINTIQQSDEPYRLTLRIPLPLAWCVCRVYFVPSFFPF